MLKKESIHLDVASLRFVKSVLPTRSSINKMRKKKRKIERKKNYPQVLKATEGERVKVNLPEFQRERRRKSSGK